jgi:ribose transport system substrate-binding protein
MKKIVSLSVVLLMVFGLIACSTPSGEASISTVPTSTVPASSSEPATEDGSGKRPVLGLNIFAIEGEYFSNLAHWMEVACADHNWDIKVASGEIGDPSTQIEIIENFITLGVDAIFINPLNMSATDTALFEAKAQGIWILGQNYQPGDSDAPDILMTGSPFEAGEQIAMLAKKLVDSGDFIKEGAPVKFAAIVDYTNENNSNRIKAMIDLGKEYWGEEGFAGEGTVGSNQVADAMAAAENMTQVNPDINVWLCYNDEVAIGVQEFYNSSGVAQDDVIIVGLDGNKAALEAVAAGGAFRGTVSQALHINCQKFMDAADILMDTGNVEEAQALIQGNGFVDVTIDNVQEHLEAASSW